MLVRCIRLAAIAGLLALTSPLAAQVPPPPGVTALAVGATPGTGDAEWVAAAPGLGDLLIYDILQLIKSDGPDAHCKMIMVEWRRRAEVIKEIEFQQSRFVDPATRVRPGQMIEPTVMITGSSHGTADHLSYTFEMRSHPDGALLGTVSGEESDNQKYLDVTEKAAREIVDKLCKKGWTASGGGPRIQITGEVQSITEVFTLNGSFPGGAAVFTYAPSGETSGTVSYTLAGSGVSGAGSGTYTMADMGEGTYQISQTTNGCIDGVPNSCKQNAELITLTPVD